MTTGKKSFSIKYGLKDEIINSIPTILKTFYKLKFKLV